MCVSVFVWGMIHTPKMVVCVCVMVQSSKVREAKDLMDIVARTHTQNVIRRCSSLEDVRKFYLSYNAVLYTHQKDL